MARPPSPPSPATPQPPAPAPAPAPVDARPAGGSFRTAGLALLGIASLLSAWLAYQSLQSGPVPGCQDGECGIVLSSKWAKVFGFPVGVFGTLTYLGLVAFARRPFDDRERDRRNRVIAGTLLLLIPAAGLWFAGLQLFVIKAFCKWCSATHALATTGAILMALAWKRETRPAVATPNPAPAPASKKGKPAKSRPATASAAAAAAVAPMAFWGTSTVCAAVAFGGFVVVQSLSPEPPKRRIVTASMSSTPTPAPAPAPAPAPVAAASPTTSAVPAAASNPTPPTATTTSTAPAPVTANVATQVASNAAPVSPPPAIPTTLPPTLSLHDGKFVLVPSELPRYGSTNAPHRFVMISDYTCVHCRHANQILAGVRETFGPSKLSVVMLPTHHGGDSLEIQEMMLATWQLDPKVWSEVSTELYFERLQPKTALVRPVLETKLGAPRLAEAIQTHRPWITNLIATTKAILVANREKTKSGSIPQFVIGSEIVVGAPEDAAEFFQLLEKNLGLVRDQFPELAPESTHLLLGKVFAGTTRTVTLGVTNTGSAPLQISRATTPPGGRVLRGLQTLVPPGESTVLDVALLSPREAGPFDQQLVLFSNARSNETRIRVSGLVWKPIRITPTTLDFGRLDPDNTRTQGVLRLEFEEAARVASVRSQNPGFSAELREVSPGKAYDIEVTTTASLGLGSQQANLLVTLAKPVPAGWPESLAFSARAIVDRPVTVVPQRMVLPSGPLPNERHLQALVRCSDSSPDFKVVSAVIEGGPAITLPQIMPSGGNGGTIIRFTLPAGWSVPPPPVQPRLVIQTTHPKIPTLEVPFVTQ